MRATTLVIAVFGIVATAQGGELADLAAKQKAAVYTPADAGLKSYIVEFTASIWAQIPQLKDAKLVFDSTTGEFTAEGVVGASAAKALHSMKMPFGTVRTLSRVPSYRVDELGEGFTTIVRKKDDLFEVVAIPKPDHPNPRVPKLVIVTLDGRGLLVRHEKELRAGGTKILSDFKWEPVGEKWLPLGYTRTEEGKQTHITMAWTNIGGVHLPVRVAATQPGNFEYVYTLDYGMVVGPPEDAFRTPEAAVKSFIEACVSGDQGLMAKCLHEDAESEFDVIRQHRATEGQLAELKAAFGASKVKSTKVAEDGKTAVVRVSMMRGPREVEEQIEVARDEHGEWKIVAF